MASTFLELVQQAANELGLPEPSQIIGAVDDTSKQLLALSQREGKEFSQKANKNGGWNILHKEYTFQTNGYTGFTGNTTSGSAVITGMSSTTGIVAGMVITASNFVGRNVVVSVDSSTQVTMTNTANATSTGISMSFGYDRYDLPSDLEYFATKTFWDGSYRWQLLGALEAQEKNVIRYGISPVGPRRRFWIIDNKIEINPVPTNRTDTIAFDYFSNAWCKSSGGTAQAKWIADTDTYILDEDCFVLGLKWRFLRAKGLDYTQEYETYQNAANRIMARDGSGRDLPMNAQATSINLLNSTNVPDTGFGSGS